MDCKLFQWACFLPPCPWLQEYGTWLWHLLHWYLNGQSGSWYNFHSWSWNSLKLKQPSPVYFLCCPAALQSSFADKPWWTPKQYSLLLCWHLVRNRYCQLFTSVPASGIFPGCIKSSFCTAAVFYMPDTYLKGVGEGVWESRLRFPVLWQKQGVKTGYFFFKEKSKRGNAFMKEN